MAEPKDRTQFNIRLPRELQRQLRVEASLHGMPLEHFCEILLRQALRDLRDQPETAA